MSLYLNRAKIFENTVGGYSKWLYSYPQQTEASVFRLHKQRHRDKLSFPPWDGDAERHCDPRISGDTHIRKRQGGGERRDESGSLVEGTTLLQERVEPQNRLSSLSLCLSKMEPIVMALSSSTLLGRLFSFEAAKIFCKILHVITPCILQ